MSFRRLPVLDVGIHASWFELALVSWKFRALADFKQVACISFSFCAKNKRTLLPNDGAGYSETKIAPTCACHSLLQRNKQTMHHATTNPHRLLAAKSLFIC